MRKRNLMKRTQQARIIFNKWNKRIKETALKFAAGWNLLYVESAEIYLTKQKPFDVTKVILLPFSPLPSFFFFHLVSGKILTLEIVEIIQFHSAANVTRLSLIFWHSTPT